MNFTSVEFFLLFAFVLGIYYFLPHKPQNYLLLAASIIFYGWWDWRFVGLLLATSGMDYYCARWVDPKRRPNASLASRRRILSLAIFGNLSVLAIFKYYNFFMQSSSRLLAYFHLTASFPLLSIILPVGISFFTFHEMSYTIDVFKGEFPSVDSFPDYLLYVCFFPHLVAGPIQRAANLLPQIQSPRRFSMENIYSGLQLALMGYFKKMVIADNLAVTADMLYNHPVNGAHIILATYAFAFEIYCDFSGYTDIARGIARMLGIQIPLNFNLPYLATNISDFWKRWHISLSTWLRDYLYIPLGGNRGGHLKTVRNLMITMVLGGLWHGASWHFVAWGFYHGVLLCIYYFWKSTHTAQGEARTNPQSIWTWVSVLLLFQFVCVGWSLFRADSIAQWILWARLVLWHTHVRDFIMTPLIQWVAFTIPLVAFELFQNRKHDVEIWRSWPVFAKAAYYIIIGYAIVWAGSPIRLPFIYFQF
jgi:alginate O-acetyltransferase complex protein AlgI